MFPGLQELSPCLPHAILRVDRRMRALWVDPALTAKTGVVLTEGQSLLDVLERGPDRDRLEAAIRAGRSFEGAAITCAFHQVWAQVRPSEPDGELWVLFRPSGADDEVAFARALQEIARAVGEILEVDAVCAAAVVTMVRCAQLRRAAVYLKEEGGPRRVAVSDLGGEPDGPLDPRMEDALGVALDKGEAQLGILRLGRGRPDTIFAAVPLQSQKRTQGALLLCKPEGTTFSVREMDLWSAAAAQLAVAVENARLLREAQAALRIRDEFISIASHELKTPLTPLKMTFYLMERKLAEGRPIEVSAVIKAKRQVDRLTGLVNQLLEASRVELGKLAIDRAPLDFGQLVVEAVEEFRAAYDRDLRVSLPEERVMVKGDRDRLDQVVVNLIENALKYSPNHLPVEVALERRDGEMRLSVRDRGIGIPPAEQARIFQRFYRAQNASTRHFGGLGLGLFISHSVVSLHGGRLEVSSEEGNGSTFAVRLPLLSRAELGSQPKRVLLLDAGGESRERARACLARAGFLVAEDEGQEALRNLVARPLSAIVLNREVAASLTRMMLDAVSSMPLALPIPVIWAGERSEWAESATVCCDGTPEAIARAVELVTDRRPPAREREAAPQA
jgi:signal transduction histidine kinase